MTDKSFALVWPAKLGLDVLEGLANRAGLPLQRAVRNMACTHVLVYPGAGATDEQREKFVIIVGLFVFSYLNPKA